MLVTRHDIYIYIYVVHSISFKAFLVQASRIVVDSWKFSMLLLLLMMMIAIDLMRWWTKFYDFRFKGTATAAIGIHATKPDCHSWWTSKIQSGREDTLEERYATKCCFKLGKNATETYRMLQTTVGASCMNRASVLNSIRDSRKAESLWGRMRGVGGERKSIH